MFQARFQPSAIERDNKFLQHQCTMSSSRSPWHLRDKPVKKWNEYTKNYATPFALMGKILTNWPGTRPTSEMVYEMRHRRLVEMIAGYPEIVTGKRPLDIPTHHLSIDALKLSLYFDSLENKFSKNSEWSSLRTTLLDWDLLEPALHKENEERKESPINKLHSTYIGCLIHHIELFEEIDKLSEEGLKQFELDKSNFLRVLHSSHNSRRGYWPGETKLVKKPGTFAKAMNSFTLLSQNDGPFEELSEDDSEENSHDSSMEGFYEHSVKFEKIQSWIRWYCDHTEDDSPLKSNIRQNLHLGASAILEGVFARIRSKVLAEKRPGAITVDGGGRICFISTESPDEEKIWINEIITQSLDLDAAHLHPYNQVIIDSIKKWGMLTNRAYLIDRTGKKIFWKNDNEKFTKLDEKKEAFWRDFLTSQLRHITGKYYPNANQDYKENNTSSKEKSKNSFYKNKDCYFCMGADLELKKASSPRELLGTCDVDAEGIKNQVCVFHHVIFYLGNAVKIRQQSQLLKSVFAKNQHTIHHVIHLDGNGIGQIFTQDYQKIDRPSYHEADPYKANFENLMLPFWSENCDAITNLNESWRNIMQMFEDQFDERLAEHPKILKLLRNRRVQSYLQRKRRSFDFNANWWISFHEGIYSNPNNPLEPWVAAGDDLILINRKTNDVLAVMDTLEQFHDSLMNYFDGSVPISFGAGVSGKVEKDISITIKNSHEAEKSAKHSWKNWVLEIEDKTWLVSESAKIAHKKQAEISPGRFSERVLAKESCVPSIVHIWRNEVDE